MLIHFTTGVLLTVAQWIIVDWGVMLEEEGGAALLCAVCSATLNWCDLYIWILNTKIASHLC